MRQPFWARLRWDLGEWLAARWPLAVLRYDGVAPSGLGRFVNRINGHVVVR